MQTQEPNQNNPATTDKPQFGGHPGGMLEMMQRFQVMGLFLHEVLFGALVLVYFLASGDQKRTLPFEVLYFGLVIATIPVLCFRCLENWRRLDGKWFFLLLIVAWLIFFHLLGNATLGYINTPSLLHWMYTTYTLQSPIADDGHAILIPFVVVGLLWWKRKELLALPLRPWWPGLLLVAAALFAHIVGYAVQQPRVSIAALFGGIYALTGLVWGPAFLRASFFPFFLFGFMIPLGTLTETLTFPLRLLVTRAVAWICHTLLAIDVVCNGTQLFNGMRTYQYDVAPACSGIRSLVAITAIAIIYAFTIFRNGWQRVLIVASAIPLALIGNTFRMLVIVLAAELWGQGAGNKAHESAFWSLLPYAPAILGLMLLGRWLETFPDRNAKAGKPASGGVKSA